MNRQIVSASRTVLASLLASGVGHGAVAGTLTVNVNGDPVGAGTCPVACSLRQAIATAIGGDTLVFASGLTSPIALSQGPLVIDKSLTLQGPGTTKLTVSALNASRVLEVNAQVMISGITFADGAVTGAMGGPGANADIEGADGGTGGSGDSVGGGCLVVDNNATLLLDRAAVHHCVAQGGRGGTGGDGGDPHCFAYDSGSYFCTLWGTAGAGGYGGPGGAARGGAILVHGALTLTNSSVSGAAATGGEGGHGGAGGANLDTLYIYGRDGDGGDGGLADGGAIFADSGASLRVTNSTISGNTATGGQGGHGGERTFYGGYGGDGGSAYGGLLFVGNGVTIADVEFSTLTDGLATGGLPGHFGFSYGSGFGNAIFAATPTTMLSSIIVGAQSAVSLCNDFVAAAADSVNLSEDNSCSGFTLHANFAQTLRPLDVNATPWPAYMPVWHGPAIDVAVNCKDLAAQSVTDDQHGTHRPQGAQCDLGAIETDYTFVDGFD